MTPILLVWEEVPESIKTYMFDADGAMMEWLPLCHRTFIGVENSKNVDAALLKLSEFLETIKPVDDTEPFQSGDRLVVLSGFIL